MTKTKPHSQGSKTTEQHKRTLEQKPDMPRTDADGQIADGEDRNPSTLDRSKRQSEFPVSRGGMNQEDRRHNKPAPN